MKIKKTSLWACLIAFGIIISVTMIFATSASVVTANENTIFFYMRLCAIK